MELDDLKDKWKEQEMTLEKSLKLNEKLLKNTFIKNANGEIESLLNWEYFSLIEFTIFLIFMGISTYKSVDDFRLLISGIFITSFLTLCIIVTIIEIRQIQSIDLFSMSIIDTKKMILKFKRQSNNYFKILLFINPPIIVTFLLPGVYFVRNINLFDHPVFLIILSISIIILSYLISYISYRIICLRKLRQIDHYLLELEKFKEEYK